MWGVVSLMASSPTTDNPADSEQTDLRQIDPRQIDHEQGETPMSEQGDYAAETQSESAPEPRTPLAAGSEQKGPLPAAAAVAIEDILPVNARLFSEHRWLEYFARSRAEDPVHFN